MARLLLWVMVSGCSRAAGVPGPKTGDTLAPLFRRDAVFRVEAVVLELLEEAEVVGLLQIDARDRRGDRGEHPLRRPERLLGGNNRLQAVGEEPFYEIPGGGGGGFGPRGANPGG